MMRIVGHNLSDVTGLYEWMLGKEKMPEGTVGELPFEVCKAGFQNFKSGRGWVDASGAPLYVPPGNLAEPHHSACFRLYNVTQEAARHAKDGGGAVLNFPGLNSMQWGVIRAASAVTLF